MDSNNYINDTVGRIQKIKEDKAEKRKEFEEEMSLIIKGVASTENGEEFFKRLVNYVGLFKTVKSFGEKELIVSRSQEMVYLNLIRPYLTKEQRKVIEND